MRRRHPLVGDLYPRHLLEYDPADWPRSKCHPECAYWLGIRAWDLEHPDDAVPFEGGPDTPFHPEAI